MNYLEVIALSVTVIAVFMSYGDAERAAYSIRDNGLRTSDISIIVRDAQQYESQLNHDASTHVCVNEVYSLTPNRSNRISDGVITGGILGGFAGIVAGAVSMFVPGLGTIAAFGPISGLISGLVTGGIVGGLMDLGIPQNKGRQYENLISQGNTLLSMKADEDRVNHIIDVLNTNGAVLVEKY